MFVLGEKDTRRGDIFRCYQIQRNRRVYLDYQFFFQSVEIHGKLNPRLVPVSWLLQDQCPNLDRSSAITGLLAFKILLDSSRYIYNLLNTLLDTLLDTFLHTTDMNHLYLCVSIRYFGQN